MLFKTKYFTYNCLIKGLYISLLFSAFIYLEYFDISNTLFNSFLALMAIYTFLTTPRASLFWAGFFTAILWFWWIGISFIHYDLTYLIPFVLLGIGLIYGTLFTLSSLYSKLWIRALLLFLLSFISPFGFNWFKPELFFINSYFQSSKFAFALIIVCLSLFIFYAKSRYKLLTLLPLVFAINTQTPKLQLPPLTISMPQYNIEQDDKWNQTLKKDIIALNIARINHAIKENYDMVVLPETAFPMLLNTSPQLMQELKLLSQDIAIVTGAMHMDKEQYHNSTYFFKQGDVQIANKVVLVPFGEAVPFPDFIRDFINNSFYNGAQDYSTADHASDFEFNGIKFRNAICYETTTDKIYEKTPPYVLSLSNNAWFTPSTEPTLQKLLMKYYARKYNVTIFAIANKSKNQIIY
ncbi:MAG: apolipoprotein N-acyltransferase [Campylobacterota bacterium]|nr:apolipoprotein N-acyltransferase [Campylobacterota bacterium]